LGTDGVSNNIMKFTHDLAYIDPFGMGCCIMSIFGHFNYTIEMIFDLIDV